MTLPAYKETQVSYVSLVNEILPGARIIKLKGYAKGNTDYSTGKKSFGTWKESASLEDLEIKRWLMQKGWIGAVIPQDRIVVDVDNSIQGEAVKGLLEGENIHHHCIKSPNGWQFVFKAETEASKEVTQVVRFFSQLGVVIDTRTTDTGYIVFPTENTEGRFIVTKSLDNLDEVPHYLKPVRNSDHVKDKITNEKYVFPVPIQEAGSRNDTLYRFAAHLKAWNVDPEEIRKSMELIYEYFLLDKTDFSSNELENLINSAIQWKPERTSRELKVINQDGEIEVLDSWWSVDEFGRQKLLHDVLAEHLLEKHSIVRYPDAQGYLYFYNPSTGLYEMDKVCRQLRSFIRNIHPFKVNQVREVQEYIVDMSPVVTEISKQYIAVNNGLLDLKTLEFRDFTPDIFVTTKIPTDYNPDAFDDFVEDTLNRVTDGYEPSRKNIEEMFGCILYPKILVPQMFYLYGSTAHNGKSSVLYLIQKTFNYHGGNISAISPQKLATNTFASSSIYGKLVNIVDDQPDQLIEDSGTLKTIITGGYVDIERKGKDSETVQMSTVLITASNYYPNFKEHGKQINRRLHIIPFEHDFSNDPDCLSELESMERMSTENAREYVLKLSVDAVKRMLSSTKKDRLTLNEKSQQARLDFAEHSDPLTDFFFEFKKEFFERVSGTEALEMYDTWCKENYITHALGAKRFKDAVCSKYDMKWMAKRISVPGGTRVVKGFKSK